MPLPDFLILGAPKAGTTALFFFLHQHPEIRMSPVKEPGYFAFADSPPEFRGPGDRRAHLGTITTLSAYERLWPDDAGGGTRVARGEATPFYLYSPEAAGRIHRQIPKARLIAILRDPAERAYSHFLHLVRDRREPLREFARALDEEDARVAAGWEWSWHYRRIGLYHAQLRRYRELFPAEQIKVFLFEDLRRDPLAVVREIFTHLDVDPSFVPDLSLRPNVSGIPRSQPREDLLRWLLRRPRLYRAVLRPLLPAGLRGAWQKRLMDARRRNLEMPALPTEVRRRLVAAYRDEIAALQELLGRDLAAWLRE